MTTNIEIHEANGATVLECHEAITCGKGEEELKRKVAEALAVSHVNLVVDFSKVTMIDSAGIGTLIASWNHAHQAGGNLKLANFENRSCARLRQMGLLNMFEIFPTTEQAVASYGAEAHVS